MAKEEDIEKLYGLAMRTLLEKEDCKYCLSQKLFDKNYGRIMLLASCRNNTLETININANFIKPKR